VQEERRIEVEGEGGGGGGRGSGREERGAPQVDSLLIGRMLD